MSNSNPKEYTGEDIHEDKKKAKNLFTAVTILFVASVIAVVAVLLVSSHKKDDDREVTVDISSEERSDAESFAKDFLSRAGNFGLKDGIIDDSSIKNLVFLVSSDSENKEKYLDTRKSVYRELESDIVPNSPLSYDSRDVQSWSPNTEERNLMSYRIGDITAHASKKASRISESGDEEAILVPVEVSFTSKETMRAQTSNDAKWDGTFAVRSRTASNVTAKMNVAKVNGEWKAYSITELNEPYLLATWENPNSGDYGTSFEHFENTGTIKSGESK